MIHHLIHRILPVTQSRQQEENKNEFVTDYVVKVADTVITIETRPKRKKFKSRLVEK